MERIYIGPTGAGKTTRLLEAFHQIGDETERIEDCLVLVKNATSVTKWRSQIELPQLGPPHIYTYFGFIQREIRRYWPWIEPLLPGEVRTLEPTFMTVETSHYLMSRLVEQARGEGAFAAITATDEQIAVQLIDNLNHAAMNQLSFQQVKVRLFHWAAADPEKLTMYQQALEVMQQFRKETLFRRTLDYSLIMELYNAELLAKEEYIQRLYQEYQYLIVDNLEKTVPVAQDLLLILMEGVKETYMSFDSQGGFASFFGGNPQLARKTFFPLCELVYLEESHTSSADARELAQALADRVSAGKSIPDNQFIKKEIQTDLRGDMLIQTAKEVEKLITGGVQPGDIALVAPIIDKVLHFTLERYFAGKGYALANLTRNKRLLDEPFAQALITLAILVNPKTKMDLNFSALVQTLSLILRLDPIRSAHLAEEIFKNKLVLPDLDEIRMRPQLGFDNSEKYDLFRNWLTEKQEEELEMEHFFQIVFGELLAPLKPEEKDILACRQLIDSITKFKRVVRHFSNIDDEQLGEDFIKMVLEGTLAAEVLFRPPSNEKQIILATPYTFLYSPYIKNVRYLFWLDVASDHWLQSSVKELTNPYVLSRQWHDEDQWDDQVDQKVRKEQLIQYIMSLLGKCQDGLYLANSYLNSRGWEQEGELWEWLQGDLPIPANNRGEES